jgi:hypothetical protein
MFALPAIFSQNSIVVDPFTVLIHLKGDNNWTDSSSFSRTIVTSGSSSFSTDKKYGTHSMNFNANNSFVYTLSMGSENVANSTIECWIKGTPTNNRGILSLVVPGGGSSAANSIIQGASGQGVVAWSNNLTAFSMPTAWTHVAWVINNSNVTTVFVNGVQQSSNTTNNINGLNYGQLTLGAYFSSSFPAVALIDSFRVSRGQRYTSNFNPETGTGLAY